MHTVGDILDEKGRNVLTTASDATVLAAVDAMCGAHVGALLVCEGDRPVGIISERDVMARVILARRDPATTRVVEVMTSEVVCIDADAKAHEAMAVMTERRCRHLPVVAGGRVAGMVSIGDLVRWASREHEYEIRMLTEYVGGAYPLPH